MTPPHPGQPPTHWASGEHRRPPPAPLHHVVSPVVQSSGGSPMPWSGTPVVEGSRKRSALIATLCRRRRDPGDPGRRGRRRPAPGQPDDGHGSGPQRFRSRRRRADDRPGCRRAGPGRGRRRPRRRPRRRSMPADTSWRSTRTASMKCRARYRRAARSSSPAAPWSCGSSRASSPISSACGCRRRRSIVEDEFVTGLLISWPDTLRRRDHRPEHPGGRNRRTGHERRARVAHGLRLARPGSVGGDEQDRRDPAPARRAGIRR